MRSFEVANGGRKLDDSFKTEIRSQIMASMQTAKERMESGYYGIHTAIGVLFVNHKDLGMCFCVQGAILDSAGFEVSNPDSADYFGGSMVYTDADISYHFNRHNGIDVSIIPPIDLFCLWEEERERLTKKMEPSDIETLATKLYAVTHGEDHTGPINKMIGDYMRVAKSFTFWAGDDTNDLSIRIPLYSFNDTMRLNFNQFARLIEFFYLNK